MNLNFELNKFGNWLAIKNKKCTDSNQVSGLVTDYLKYQKQKQCDHDYVPVGCYDQNGSFICTKCKHKI